MNKPLSNADYYLEIGFNNDVIKTGETVECKVRFNKNDWSNYNQSNDYSFNSD